MQATTVLLHIHSVNMCPFREPGRFCLQKFFVCNGFTVSRPLLALMRLKSNLTCSLRLYNFDPGVVSSCRAASTSVHKSNTFKISNFELLVHFCLHMFAYTYCTIKPSLSGKAAVLLRGRASLHCKGKFMQCKRNSWTSKRNS